MDNQIQIEKVRLSFKEFLRKSGHRITRERLTILDTVCGIEGHFDIEKLYEIMDTGNRFHVSRATLYNTIELLQKAQIVVRHQFGGSSQFEFRAKKETHHHMICTQCGRVKEFQNETLQEAIQGTKLARFTLSHYSLYVYGLCSRCERANRKKNIENK